MKNFLKETPSENTGKSIVIACSSDRGLCGAIHSSISRIVRKMARDNPELMIVVLGDKAKPQIAREARKQIIVSFNQMGKAPPSFSDAISVMQFLDKNVKETGDLSLTVLYNNFKSVIAYESGPMAGILSKEKIKDSKGNTTTYMMIILFQIECVYMK